MIFFFFGTNLYDSLGQLQLSSDGFAVVHRWRFNVRKQSTQNAFLSGRHVRTMTLMRGLCVSRASWLIVLVVVILNVIVLVAIAVREAHLTVAGRWNHRRLIVAGKWWPCVSGCGWYNGFDFRNGVNIGGRLIGMFGGQMRFQGGLHLEDGAAVGATLVDDLHVLTKLTFAFAGS